MSIHPCQMHDVGRTTQDRVVALYEKGFRPEVIADYLDIKHTSCRTYLANWRRKNGIHLKRTGFALAPENAGRKRTRKKGKLIPYAGSE